jgi:hypothetical protein
MEEDSLHYLMTGLDSNNTSTFSMMEGIDQAKNNKFKLNDIARGDDISFNYSNIGMSNAVGGAQMQSEISFTKESNVSPIR